jgi:hypothetical protein
MGAVKLSVTISDSQLQQLQRVALAHGVTLTEVVRHGIALENFFLTEKLKGNIILTRSPRGSMQEVLIGWEGNNAK